MERVSVLPKTIDIGVLWQIGLDAEVLWLEYDGVRFGGEQDFRRGRTRNGEGERGRRVVEMNGG
jgi:hypothetical protein